jgi:hypothetical protein
MFEPFHPHFVEEMRSLPLFFYARPNNSDCSFEKRAEMVFTGRLMNDRVDSHNGCRLYRRLLVKDIFAHLFAAAVRCRFPQTRLVIILRNPFDVALSKLALRPWHWMENPCNFLCQPHLVDDYLSPFQDMIRGCPDDFVARQLMIWSIIHYVLLRQIAGSDVCVVFYERLRQAPESEFRKVLDYIYPGKINQVSSEMLARCRRPSRVSRPFHVSVTGLKNQRLEDWQREYGAKILSAFGLSSLYGPDGAPQGQAFPL